MTQEEKELLLKDLCARLPYGIKCLVNFDDKSREIMTLKTGLPNAFGKWDFYNEKYSACSDNFKPYLRSLSSMTEEEMKVFWEELDKDMDILEANIDTPIICEYYGRCYRGNPIYHEIDFLNRNMFDWRGLIPMGLALEAPENMYVL